MLEKLKARRVVLKDRECSLLAELKKVQAKIGVVDEMIAEETASAGVEVASDETPVAESADKADTSKIVTIRI